MAPQRGTKKSSSTSISQITTRPGQQITRRRVIEEVQELDDIDDANAMEIEGQSSQAEEVEEEVEDSPKTADNSIEELMTRMVDDQRKRLATRKRGVKKSYTTDHETVRKSLTTLFDNHEQQASLAHQAQIKRLQELLARKAEIEARMAEKLKHLRESYDAHSRDLERVISYKINTLK